MLFSKRQNIKCGHRTIDLGSRTFIMGILNITPDSFSDGGHFLSVDSALRQAELLLEHGADIIDIGGESTRPFAKAVLAAEEQRRILPVVKALVHRGISNLSIDTRNAVTAKVCLAEGASWINDVSAFGWDEGMLTVCQKADACILMHSKNTPDIMQIGEINYDDVVVEVSNYLKKRVEIALQHGFDRNRLLIDPGIGFGKNLKHNLRLICNLNQFENISAGILCGISRKAFIREITGISEAKERDNATLAALTCSILRGADIVRVHNVKAAKEAILIADAFKREKENEDLYETW